ncbi:MAG: elongation factor G [Myxococcales bacterium]|nr:elongation factor G [Myxococcales bacterium]
MELEKVRNIGISAHIDSGKTTLTERILFYTGRIHKIEEVRGKSGVGAKMDSMELERERGITIQSAATHVTWGDHHINIIDTPGHVDFTIEVERALSVLDGAILILCAVSGVQSQSITVDRQMRRYNVPRVAFINKMDRSGANPFKVTKQLREKLHHNAVMITYPIGAEDEFHGIVDLLTREALYFDGDNGENIRKEPCPEELAEDVEEYRNKLVEALADFDDEIAEKFLEGEEVSADEMRPVIRQAVLDRTLTPVYMGSAYKNKGVQHLLDGVASYLPNPTEVENKAFDLDENEAEIILESVNDKPLCALAFKLEDGKYGQLTYVRVYQGLLKKGIFIYNARTRKKVKVGRLVRMHSDEMEDIEEAGAGDIVALFGIDCASGDTFTDGQRNYSMQTMFVPDAVINYAVAPKNKNALQNFSKALNRFAKEDPTFRVSRDEESGETIIAGMGELHLDVYIERMRREYKVDVDVGEPQVAYRETITAETAFMYIHKKQTGGSGQYAKLGGFMRPLSEELKAEHKHYNFLDKIVGGKIPREYIPSCDNGFKKAMDRGVLIGFPVVDVEMEINDGAAHAVDSSDMAFQIAARAAFKETMARANPIVLEPIMKVVVETPEDFQGPVQAGLIRRRGNIVGSETNYGTAAIEIHVPLAEMFGYSTELRSATQGKAEFSMEFHSYGPVPRSIQDELVKKYAERAR